MKSFTRCLLMLSSLYIPIFSVNASEGHWTYNGEHGPDHWGALGNSLCASGTQQSPINIEINQVLLHKIISSNLALHYGKTALKLQNNGHTIQANVGEGEKINFQGTEYQLMQFHFHTPSEHQINHLSFPMEMHLVHQDQNGQLLVVGLMIKEGNKNIELASLWSNLPRKDSEEITLSAEAAPDLNKLIPLESHHLYYKGSLTTPPCTEGVQWVLFEQPIEMSKSQIKKFRELFSQNHRPAQPINEREVDED
ncbi:carbonic anhydrase family protein [Pseudomonas sp. TH49]|uniref:carbonic anhydrase n=1 Tax=Pseudomonas sp. TH49 TaxID=2796413 RepID=UPI001911B40D|nr:carbonic anhydrase family protein [Pseudomonas sp. TH49]MBK5344664.1 carbonic anhydrase family protein [Pseudomonas sp. TH49]